MEHQAAAALLHDFALGQLTADTRAEVEAHLASCNECREGLATMRDLRGLVDSRGAALFSAHPHSDDLATYAVESAALSTADLARIGDHLRACPTCLREIEIARRARASAWQRSLPAWLWDASAHGLEAWLRPALAALAVVLAYPAYLGVVEYPHEHARTQQLTRRADDLLLQRAELLRVADASRLRLSEAQAWGGAVQPLMLSGPRRATAGEAPSVALRPDQPALPVLIDLDLTVPRPRQIEITLRRSGQRSPAWRYSAPASELWDPSGQLLSLLVPAAALSPGDYALEVRPAGVQTALYLAPFVVRATPAR